MGIIVMRKLDIRWLLVAGLMLLIGWGVFSGTATAQPQLDVRSMTQDDIKKLTYEQLLELDLPDLMLLADKMGVSTDELLAQAFLVKTSTSSKARETVFEAPMSTTVITQEKILHSGATTIAELFRMVPGMVVREQTPGNYDVHVRGLDNVPPGNFIYYSSNSLTLVMVNGRPLFNHTMGNTLWESLPVSLEDIERIDVVRGAASAMYGANAVTGVINIVTKPLASVLSASGRVRTYVQERSTLSYSASARVSVPLPRGWRIGLRQHAEMRKQVDDQAYSYATGSYMLYDNLLNITGDQYYHNWNEMRRVPKGWDAEEVVNNGNRSLDVRGIMGDVNYDGQGLNFAMTGGYWFSRSRAPLMENYVTPLSMRMQSAAHLGTNLSWRGLTFVGSYFQGTLDAGIGQAHPGTRFDMQDLNFNVEYSWEFWNQLTIRPGAYFQNVIYDDTRWDARWKGMGYIGGAQGLLGGHRRQVMSLALALRADWRPIEQLRIIAAARVDKYSIPSAYYPTWQFIVTYRPHENHLLRAVAARANKSSFMVENSTQVKQLGVALYRTMKSNAALFQAVGIEPDDDDYFLYQEFYGNQGLKLLQSDFVELGYRAMLGRVTLDLELFGSRTFNFNDMRLVNTVLTFGPSEMVPSRLVPRMTSTFQYRNLPLVVWQGGATLSLNYAPLNNLLFNLFGTWQTTVMDHFQEGTMFSATEAERSGVSHGWTPAVSVGLVTEYRAFDKLHFFLETYFKTPQKFEHGVMPGVDEEHGRVRIAPYGLCNFTVSYDALSNLSLQVGVRNLYITNRKNYSHGFAGREFGFTDRLRPLYHVGVQMSL